MAEQLESVEALVEDYGGSDWKAATRQEERTALWAARHNAFWAIKDKWAGKDLIATDIAVPVSNLAELVRATNADMAELGISAAPLFGHVGDGSFHLLPMFDSSDEDEVRRRDLSCVGLNLQQSTRAVRHTSPSLVGTMMRWRNVGSLAAADGALLAFRRRMSRGVRSSFDAIHSRTCIGR